jgi:3-oxoacyl-[acyl-carrier protein] reductase
MSDLKGKVVCITGASRGLGKAIAEAFDAAGARLVLASRSQGALDALASSLSDAIAVQTDVRDAEDLERLVGAAVGEFGHIDVMVNNAGLAVYGPVENTSVEAVNQMIDTNLKGVIFGSQAAFRAMKLQRSGHIINISSIAGKLHLKNEAVYNASKWGVNGFSGTLALEARHFGVKVSTLCPGGIHTPFWKEQEFYPFPDHIDPERDFLDPVAVAEAVVGLAKMPENCLAADLVLLPMTP